MVVTTPAGYPASLMGAAHRTRHVVQLREARTHLWKPAYMYMYMYMYMAELHIHIHIHIQLRISGSLPGWESDQRSLAACAAVGHRRWLRQYLYEGRVGGDPVSTRGSRARGWRPVDVLCREHGVDVLRGARVEALDGHLGRRGATLALGRARGAVAPLVLCLASQGLVADPDAPSAVGTSCAALLHRAARVALFAHLHWIAHALSE